MILRALWIARALFRSQIDAMRPTLALLARRLWVSILCVSLVLGPLAGPHTAN